MTFQPHLQPINFGPSTPLDDASTFPLFTTLPSELRIKIWQYAVRRPRLIHLYLNNQRGKSAFSANENPDSVANNELYFTIVNGTHLYSKYMRINQESRKEALKFHRVHLPCRFTTDGNTFPERGGGAEGAKNHGTLHFNPEWDILHINAEWPAQDILIPFLHRLKTLHDPRHVGLVNLALTGLSGCDILNVQPSAIPSQIRSGFAETLAQLQEVWFVSTPVVGRQIAGPLGKYEMGTTEAMYNRSLPIATTLPTFERFPQDPRSISKDLENTPGLDYKREVMQYWLQLLKKWQIPAQNNKIKYKFLLSFNPEHLRSGCSIKQISSQSSAKTWLQEQEDHWNGRGYPDTSQSKFMQAQYPIGAQDPNYVDEDLGNAVRPAFGFWLFPLEALGRIGEDGLLVEETRPSNEKLRDMTGHWPELGLSVLP